MSQVKEQRHAAGAYYTPRYMVDAIVARTLGPLVERATPEQVLELRIIDPACGEGAFLLGAFRYLLRWHQRSNPCLASKVKQEILTRCIYGVDLDRQALQEAQRNLHRELLAGEPLEAEALPDLSGNLRWGNALVESRDLALLGCTAEELQRLNPFDWSAEGSGFGSLLRPPEQGGRGGFDVVVGNPPYIRVQQLTRSAPLEARLYRRKYTTAVEGSYDLYAVFIEQSLRLLRPGGRLGFILPTKWWQASYGAPLRRLLRQGQHYAEAIDFAHEQVFGSPTTYTCISIFTHQPTPALEYRRLSPQQLQRSGMEGAQALWAHAVPWSQLGEGPWYPGVRQGLRPLFERLRSQGPLLGDRSICPRIFQGLKTSLDSVYVLDLVEEQAQHLVVRSKALGGELLELERGPLKPIVKGGEMKRFAPLPPRKVVLFPYEVLGKKATLLRPADFQARYPCAWQYLEQNRRALEERERGKMRHDAWYAYIYPKSLALFSQPKLLTADLAKRMSFSLDAQGQLYLLGGVGGGYGLLPSRPELVGPLLALLNSSLLEWMLRPPGLSSPFHGGWFSCESRFISLLPIHLPSNREDLHALGSLAERAVAAYEALNEARADQDRQRAERQLEALEAEVDDRVFRLYGVSEREQRAVEEELAQARQVLRED